MRPIILGIDNPHRGEALAPHPPGCAGWNLWKISDLSMREYEEAFDRRNLMTKWDSGKAHEAGRQFHNSLPRGSNVIVLGQAVKEALGLRDAVIVHPTEIDGITYRVIPHPSGRNLFYNNPINRMMIRILLQWSIGRTPTATSV